MGAADIAVASARHASAGADSGPAAAAQRFYDAVRARDATTALSLLDLPRGTDRRLLTPAALAQTPSLPRAGAQLVSHQGDDAVVEVVYVVEAPAGGLIDGSGQTDEPVVAAMDLHLRRTTRGLLHDRRRWEVVDGLPTISVLADRTVDTGIVAGTSIDLTGGPLQLPAFPGLVAVSAPATPLLAATRVELVAGGPTDPRRQTLSRGPASAAVLVAERAVGAAFAQRTDRLALNVQQVVDVDGSGYGGAPDHVDLVGTVEQRDARGAERAWSTRVTVRLVSGQPVAGDVSIAPGPLPDPGLDPLNGS